MSAEHAQLLARLKTLVKGHFISDSQLTCLQKIGEGAFAVVELCLLDDTASSHCGPDDTSAATPVSPNAASPVHAAAGTGTCPPASAGTGPGAAASTGAQLILAAGDSSVPAWKVPAASMVSGWSAKKGTARSYKSGKASFVLGGIDIEGRTLVAVKRIKGGVLQDPRMARLIATEAELLCRLSHPHIVRVLGLGTRGAAGLSSMTGGVMDTTGSTRGTPHGMNREGSSSSMETSTTRVQEPVQRDGSRGQAAGAGVQPTSTSQQSPAAAADNTIFNNLFIVQEFLKGGHLRKLVTSAMIHVGDVTYTRADAVRWAGQVARALSHLHSRSPPIMHRDIKLDNILMTDADPAVADVKLADFGLATKLPTYSIQEPGVTGAAPGRSSHEHHWTRTLSRSHSRSSFYGAAPSHHSAVRTQHGPGGGAGEAAGTGGGDLSRRGGGTVHSREGTHHSVRSGKSAGALTALAQKLRVSLTGVASTGSTDDPDVAQGLLKCPTLPARLQAGSQSDKPVPQGSSNRISDNGAANGASSAPMSSDVPDAVVGVSAGMTDDSSARRGGAHAAVAMNLDVVQEDRGQSALRLGLAAPHGTTGRGGGEAALPLLLPRDSGKRQEQVEKGRGGTLALRAMQQQQGHQDQAPAMSTATDTAAAATAAHDRLHHPKASGMPTTADSSHASAACVSLPAPAGPDPGASRAPEGGTPFPLLRPHSGGQQAAVCRPHSCGGLVSSTSYGAVGANAELRTPQGSLQQAARSSGGALSAFHSHNHVMGGDVYGSPPLLPAGCQTHALPTLPSGSLHSTQHDSGSHHGGLYAPPQPARLEAGACHSGGEPLDNRLRPDDGRSNHNAAWRHTSAPQPTQLGATLGLWGQRGYGGTGAGSGHHRQHTHTGEAPSLHPTPSVLRLFGSLSGAAAGGKSGHGNTALYYADQMYNFTSRTGSLIYMAPEVYKGMPYNCKADVFSFAIVLYELLHNQLILASVLQAVPDGHDKHAAIVEYSAAVAAGYRPPISKSMPPSLSSLLLECWATNPLERPAMTAVATRLEAILRDECAALDKLDRAFAPTCGCSIS